MIRRERLRLKVFLSRRARTRILVRYRAHSAASIAERRALKPTVSIVRAGCFAGVVASPPCSPRCTSAGLIREGNESRRRYGRFYRARGVERRGFVSTLKYESPPGRVAAREIGVRRVPRSERGDRYCPCPRLSLMRRPLCQLSLFRVRNRSNPDSVLRLDSD